MKQNCHLINTDKIMHLKQASEAINIDQFAEFFLDTSNIIKTEKMHSIKDLFAAANMD